MTSSVFISQSEDRNEARAKIVAVLESRLERRPPGPNKLVEAHYKKNSFTPDALQVVLVRMKVWSWCLVIAALFAALTLGSCALNEEGVAPNPAEVPDNPSSRY
jgi:hypothetical protein